MAFDKFYITDKGATLLAKAQIGGKLTFTRATAGNGTLGTLQPTALTDIISKVADLTISALNFSSPNIASVQIQFSNKNVQSPFSWEEIGLYAKGDDNAEVLYAYANAGDHPDQIPSYGTSPTEFIFLMNTATGNAANVTAVISTDLVYATQQDIADIKDGTITVAHASLADSATTATNASQLGGQPPASYALLNSPAFTGSPTVPTAAVDTNTAQAASTAFVLGQVSSDAPLMDGTASAGTSSRFSRKDHVHPSDSYKVNTSNPAMSGVLSLTPAGGIDAAIKIGDVSVSRSASIYFRDSGNNVAYDSRIVASGGTTTQGKGTLNILAGDAQVNGYSIINSSNGSSLGPAMDGVAASGSSKNYSREDHVHPTDTSLLAASVYTAADVLTKIKTVGGSGSGLDADTVDGKHVTDFVPSKYCLGGAWEAADLTLGSGTLTADTGCFKGQAIQYAQPASGMAEVTVASLSCANLRYAQFSVAVRLRCSSVSFASAVAVIKVATGSGSAVASLNILGTDFASVGAGKYKMFYIPFENSGQSAGNSFTVSVYSEAVASTVIGIDSVVISPIQLGAYY